MLFLRWKMGNTVFEADSLSLHFSMYWDTVCMSMERLLSTSEVVQAEALRATSSVYKYLVANAAGKLEV